MSRLPQFITASLLFAIGISTSLPAQGESERARLEGALGAMQSWLGEDANARQWNDYLQNTQLKRQIALGDRANLARLHSILDSYNSGVGGMECHEFGAVRNALAAYIDVLENPPVALIPTADLPAAVRAAGEQFQPIASSRVTEARASLDLAVRNLDRFLHISSTGYSEGWKRFLHWEELQTILAAEEVDFRALDAIWRLYRANENGLEHARFGAVRHALRRYIDISFYASNDQLEQQYQALLSTLADTIEAYNAEPTAERLRDIGYYAGQLERAEQIPDLLASIRGHYQSPNFYANISAELVTLAMADEVFDVSEVNECILGTSIHGTAETTGQISGHMRPSTDEAVLDICLSGQSESDTVGYHGNIQIISSGSTEVDVVKRLLFDSEGIRLAPATAHCATHTTIHSICARLRIIESFAWKQAMKQKGEAECIASRRAEARFERRMNADVAERIAEPQENYLTLFREPLLRRDGFPQSLNISSSARDIKVQGLQMDDMQLGAPAAPAPLEGLFDMSVQLHESMVSNFSEAAIGGETLTDERLAEIVEERTGEVPEELQITDESDPWSITFDYRSPVAATFRDGQFTIAITGRQFTRGEQILNERMQIAATYNIVQTDEGLTLTRVDEVQVEFIDIEGQLGARQIAFKTFMRRKWSALFEPEFNTEGITLPGNLEKAGVLTVSKILSEGGWISLGWNRDS